MLPRDVLYQPYYCEENVFHLCQSPVLAGRAKSAVFASGARGGCVMWHQRAAPRPGAALFWDYHVFVLAEAPWEVWDLDTTLGCPVPAARYFERSFRDGLPPDLAPIFRVVAADELRATLASDRSHMRKADGRYERPPPPWPPVSPPERGSNLERFIDMSDAVAGEVLSLAALCRRFGAAPPRL